MTVRNHTDHERFDRVYAANLPGILGYAARRCADPTDAADIAADVFLVAWRRLGEVPAGEERLWLFGVARRVLANHRRGQLRRNRLADRLRDDLALLIGRQATDETTATVRAALATLSDRDQELLRLAVWDGFSPTEIAALEGVPPATVRSWLLRARSRLRLAVGAPVAAAAQRGRTSGHELPGSPATDADDQELTS